MGWLRLFFVDCFYIYIFEVELNLELLLLDQAVTTSDSDVYLTTIFFKF